MLEKMMEQNVFLYCMAGLGMFGILGMCLSHLSYRRLMKHAKSFSGLKEKWMELWRTRDRLLHRMNRFVWYPALFSTGIFGGSLYFVTVLEREGLPVIYLYVGAAVPVILLLFRQIMDVSYQEELLMSSLADYVEEMHDWMQELPEEKRTDPVLQEEIVDKITASIRQTAASGSHFSRMLSPEEEEIMREIIKEFMDEP